MPYAFLTTPLQRLHLFPIVIVVPIENHTFFNEFFLTLLSVDKSLLYDLKVDSTLFLLLVKFFNLLLHGGIIQLILLEECLGYT